MLFFLLLKQAIIEHTMIYGHNFVKSDAGYAG